MEEAPTLEASRAHWIVPRDRREMLGRLPDGGQSAYLLQNLEEMTDYDPYDVLGELGYGLNPRTCPERAEAFTYKHAEWLAGLPKPTAATIKALVGQFARGGTPGLENPHIFEMSDVRAAGGLAALRAFGKSPADVLHETKERMFAA